MNRAEVNKNGVKIEEVDFNNNGIYAGTYEFYVVDQDLYRVTTYNNDLTYNGKNNTVLLTNLTTTTTKLTVNTFCYEYGMSEAGLGELKTHLFFNL